jgi:hypothetical protein
VLYVRRKWLQMPVALPEKYGKWHRSACEDESLEQEWSVRKASLKHCNHKNQYGGTLCGQYKR